MPNQDRQRRFFPLPCASGSGALANRYQSVPWQRAPSDDDDGMAS